MMVDVQTVVEKCFGELMGALRRDVRFDGGRRLVEDYGVSSLQLVTLVTTVCEESGLALTALTERDLAAMKTVDDMVRIIGEALRRGGQA